MRVEISTDKLTDLRRRGKSMLRPSEESQAF